MGANIVTNTWHGTMIVNRHDHMIMPNGGHAGVGYQLLNTGAFDRPEVELVLSLLESLKDLKKAPILALDLGANIGCHSLVWARELKSDIRIIAVEAQPQLFWMLCGNIAINNHINIKPVNAAVGAENGTLTFAAPNYDVEGSYGSLELKQTARSEHIGQDLNSYHRVTVPCLSLDRLCSQPIDFMKVDIEGMEEEFLRGATARLQQDRPVVYYEHIKSDRRQMEIFFAGLSYNTYELQMSTLAVPEEHALKIHIEGEKET